ncbi:kinase-like domain-containing protein [Rhizophagus clarus]|uniref:Kinase-like domain-containing protein n=1 Tax=Rhizophagus clarus TaxID=94130 RepID=A0A8H3QA92_9GLOM|nr:kinase-like domain-containing protein [Rhizophagus clarus]
MDYRSTFRLTKRLKSSSLPISFIPYNRNKDNYRLHNANLNLFTWATFDVIIYTDNSIEYNSHEDKDIFQHDIQEFRGWCEKCSTILYFKQVVSDYLPSPSHIDDNCKLCGKVIDQHALLCSDCYQISSGWIRSTLTENSVLVVRLPWWDTYDQCISCNSQLEFTSDCQKQCLCCNIFYIGCRYCLTTNIIFGFTNQSQCKKCGRISFIIINVTEIKKCFLTQDHMSQIVNYTNNNSNPVEIYNFIKNLNCFPLKSSSIDCVSQSQITNLENNGENSLNLDIPITFISFSNKETNCYYCKRKYSQTLLFEQKYCVYCLYVYIDTKQIINNIDYSQISFELLESSLIKIPIFYLPWWDAHHQCFACSSQLELKSHYQKWCSNCFIVYIGCSYCLKTNIIFGITKQSQCKKCKRIFFINIDISGNDVIDEFLCFTKLNFDSNFQIDDYIKNPNPLEIYNSFKDKSSSHFLNELKSLYQCYEEKFECIIRCHGITKNPITNELMFVMKYANGGNLRDYLQKNFALITWKKKLHILWRISDGLQTIHEKDFIHRDFHSGNILVEIIESGSYSKVDQYLIGDLGLSQPANNTLSNNEIYGVIPYIAPEIFKGAKFSKASDIYSMGMIMWELTTGCKPFANIEHDTDFIYEIIDGKRPEITDDTPEDFANLMKKCWNSDPEKRPLAKKICETINHWLTTNDDDIIFNQAEEIRLELIKSRILGPEFSEPCHSQAIYTSRPLNSLISKPSSVISSTVIPSNTKQNNKLETLIEESNGDDEYITKEYELEIDDIRRESIIQNSNTQHCPNSPSSETNPLRKRNIEELNFEIQNNGKHIKTGDNILNKEFTVKE